MRILHISAAYKPAYIYGGPTMSVSMLCEQLVMAKCDVNVFTTTANGLHELDVVPNQTVQVDNVDLTYFKRITKDHSHLSPALLKAVWSNARRYDIVHIHAWWNLVSVFSAVITLMRGVPVLVSPRGTLSPYSFKNKNRSIKSLFHALLNKPVLRRCHLHVTSKRERDAMNKIISSKTTTVIPNFVKLPADVISIEHSPQATFRLLFFSRIEEKKGLDILINALAFIDIPFHLTVAGNGNTDYVERLKALAVTNQVSEKITWLDFVNDDKFDVLQSHDLFILPSYDENFGNAVIESLSVGTPVLISQDVGLADYVNENDLGWLCQTNSASIAATINRIYNRGQHKLKQIREQAPDIIHNDFGDGGLIEKYISLYSQISRKVNA